MQNKPILKNTAKYKILKMAKGKNLGEFKEYPENFGIYKKSKYDNNWVKTNQDYVYFKAKEFYSFLHTQQNRSVNELVVDEIAKQLNIKTAKYEPAYIDNLNGLISHDVAKSYEELIMLDDLFDVKSYNCNLQYIIKNWDNSFLTSYNVDKNEVIFDLFKMLVLDTLTMQEDRHVGNIFFIRNTIDNSLRLSPLIDNEFAFALKTLDTYLDDLSFDSLVSYDIDEFLSGHSKNLRFTLLEDNPEKRHQKFQKNIGDIIQFVYNKPLYKQFLIDSLKNIDVEKSIQKVEAIGYEISPDYKKYMCDVVDIVKQVFAEKIAEVKRTHPNMFKEDSDGKQ